MFSGSCPYGFDRLLGCNDKLDIFYGAGPVGVAIGLAIPFSLLALLARHSTEALEGVASGECR